MTVSTPRIAAVAEEKYDVEQIDHVESRQHISNEDAPELLRGLTHEQRAEMEAKLRRKIDMRLMPICILMYMLNYIDRTNIAAARLSGIEEDIGLTESQYLTCVSILFVGYILMQVPSNLYMNKIGLPAVYLPACMMIWGIISTATAACQSFGGLMACRFLLGFVEAAYFPGCVFLLSSWYTRKEASLRTAIFFSGALVAGAFSGLIAAGIRGNMDGERGLRAWRWLFIIEGACTVFAASFAFFIMPNFPRTTKWLTEQERQLAIWRLQEDIGIDDWTGSDDQNLWSGFKLACMDVKMWVLMGLLSAIVSAGSVANFFPSVVETIGYGMIDTLLLTVPPYALAVLVATLNAWHADRTGERYWHVVLPACVGIASFTLAAATTHAPAPRYVAMMLMVSGVYGGYVVALAWVSNSIPRPPAKRAAALGFINSISNSTSIWMPYLYINPPGYVIALSIDSAMLLLAVIFATVLRFILTRLNKRLDRGEHVFGAVSTVPGAAGDRGFRFLT